MGPEAFRQATIQHGDRVSTYAAWMLRDAADAQDVTQEAFLRLWSHRTAVAEPAARTWLLRTAHRLCLDRIRSRDREPTGLGALMTPADHTAPDQAIVDRELHDAVTRGLEALPLRDRAVLLLRVRYGLSLAELASVLEMPIGTAKAALHRARARLREQLTALEVCS
jgi:RNA polymerase sigma-70 factor (ECF subfamily)